MTAFGVNAIVLPPGIDTGPHYHDRQEELYFVHRGTIEMEFGDGSSEELAEGAFARVDPPTVRRIRNRGDVDAVYVIVGGKDGYVGRDGQVPPGEEQARACGARSRRQSVTARFSRAGQARACRGNDGAAQERFPSPAAGREGASRTTAHSAEPEVRR